MEAQHQEFVGIYDDALTEEFCASIIDAFEACPQVHSEGRIGSGVDVQKKESIDCCISEYKEWTGINQSLLNITARFLVRYVREYAFLACGALSPAVRLDSGEVLELSPENIERIPEEQLLNVILKLYRPGYLNLQKYRPSGLRDLYDAARVVDTLDHLHFFSRPLVVRDMNGPMMLDVNTAFASLAGTFKHVISSASSVETVREVSRLCHLVAGSEEAF